MDDIQKAADYWAEQYNNQTFYRREWQCHPFANARQTKLLGGYRDRAQWFKEQRLPRPAKRALGIGVGLAVTELALVRNGAVEHYDLYDISSAGLEAAKTAAEAEGFGDRVSIHCADVNMVDLPTETYDLVTFMASLHHIAELEKTLRACDRAMAPGGVLWAAEYVGPDRFQYPDEHMAVARGLYDSLHRYVRKPLEVRLRGPSAEDVIAADPTESIHSSEIVDMMTRIWPDLEFKGMYGSLMFMISWCLEHDALYDTKRGRDTFQMLLDSDIELIDAGKLPHYYAYLIARKAGD